VCMCRENVWCNDRNYQSFPADYEKLLSLVV